MKLFPTVESRNLDSGVDNEKIKNPEYSKQNEQVSTLPNGQSNDAGSLALRTGSAILTNVEGDITATIAKDRVYYTHRTSAFSLSIYLNQTLNST